MKEIVAAPSIVPDIAAVRRLPDGRQVLIGVDGSRFRIKHRRDAFTRAWRIELTPVTYYMAIKEHA